MSITAGEQAEQLREEGYTVIKAVMDETEVENYRRLVDHLYELFDPRIDHPGINVDEGAAGEPVDWSKRPQEHNMATTILARHSAFWTIPTREPVSSLIRDMLGEDVVLSSLNSLEPLPGRGHQNLHRDEGPAGPEGYVTANSIWVLDPMDQGNGATRLVPGTHRTDELTQDDDPRLIFAAADPGDVIVTNAHVLHAASRNNDGRRRRVLHAYYTQRGRVVQTDWSRYLPARTQHAMPDELKRVVNL